MKKTFFTAICLFFLLSFCFSATPPKILSVSSPNKQLWFYLRINEGVGIDYRVVYQSKEVVGWSALGLTMLGGALPAPDALMKNSIESEADETFNWPYGENASIRNQYHQIQVHFIQSGGADFDIIARVFNNNLAFRYSLPKRAGEKIFSEQTHFNFNQPYTVYRHNTESVISPTPINDLKNNSDFPLVLASPNLYISINEAANSNYTKAMIGRGEQENALAVKFAKDTVTVGDAFYTPWRTLSFSNTAIGLADNSDLLYKLCPPPATAFDYSKVKPGKLIRDMTLTTQGAKDCIDFAQRMNFQYVMYDAGWYGKGYYAEFDQSSNPNKVVPEINMQEVINYGKEKGIGLILYVNYVGLRKYNIDSSLTLYKNWGVKGLKFGFVNGLTQDGISWLMGAVKKAQDYGFIIDVHDNYKPTGLSRTYPALLTQEGVRGNENNPDAFHNTTLPFTRFLSGPADYTFCYRNQNDSFNNALLSKKLQVTKAQQLALTVIFYSPVQSMLWYGRPADYKKPEEIEFFKYVPTVWDQTLHLAGEIGKYITVARRSGSTWFVGSAANVNYTSNLNLDFLEAGKKYTATIYEDDGSGGIRKTEKPVNKQSALGIDIIANGGQSVIIRPDRQ